MDMGHFTGSEAARTSCTASLPFLSGDGHSRGTLLCHCPKSEPWLFLEAVQGMCLQESTNQ